MFDGIKTAPEHPVFAGKTHAHVALQARLAREAHLRNGRQGAIVDVNFYRAKGQFWRPHPWSAMGDFPFRSDDNTGDIVPIAGKIKIGERCLSDIELAQVGLRPIRDDENRQFCFPYFQREGSGEFSDSESREVYLFNEPADNRTNGLSSGPFVFRDTKTLFSFAKGLFDEVTLTEALTFRAIESWQSIPAEITRIPIREYLFRHVTKGLQEFLYENLFREGLVQVFTASCLRFEVVGEYLMQNDIRVIDREALLLRNGAQLAGITLSAIKFLEASAIRTILGISDYRGGDLYVLCRAMGKDIIGLCDEPFNDNQAEKLMQLTANVGRNIRAAMLSKLTMKMDEVSGNRQKPKTNEDLSSDGKIRNSSKMVEAEKIEEMFSLICWWLEDIFAAAQTAGVSKNDFIGDGRHLDVLFAEIFLRTGNFVPAQLASIKELNLNILIPTLGGSIIAEWIRFSQLEPLRFPVF